MSIEELRTIAARLNAATAGLEALGAAIELRLTGAALDGRTAEALDAVLDALGARAALAGADRAELQQLLGETRSLALLDARLIAAGLRAPGWQSDDPEILQAAGEVTSGFPDAFSLRIAPALDDLPRRLAAPGAAFLEVGVGVGRIAIGMAQRWPDLRVLGIDIWPPALALARQNVAAAGLEARIELRAQAAEELTDVAAFDLAWLPSAFVPDAALPVALARVRRALRPGGWLLLPTLRPGGDPLAAAIARLRIAGFGGCGASAPQAEALLQAAGFVDGRTLPGPPHAVSAIAVARRSPLEAAPATPLRPLT